MMTFRRIKMEARMVQRYVVSTTEYREGRFESEVAPSLPDGDSTVVLGADYDALEVRYSTALMNIKDLQEDLKLQYERVAALEAAICAALASPSAVLVPTGNFDVPEGAVTAETQGPVSITLGWAGKRP